jgi:hypothetical protein
MILQRANELAELSERVRVTEAIDSDRQRYTELRDQLVDLTRRLFPVWGTTKVFRENGIADAAADPSATSARRMAEDVAGKFKEKPAAILEQRVFRFSALREQVERLATSVEARLRTAWERHVETVVPDIDPEVLQTYALMPDKTTAVGQLRQALSHAERLAMQLPRDADQLQRFREAVAEVCRLWDAIVESGGVPAGVAEFLRLARTPTGAPLTMLTEEIVKWLRTKNMLGRYTVRTSSVAGGIW